MLVVPFKQDAIRRRVRDNPEDPDLERKLVNYNKGLSRGRIVIEHCFGLLKVKYCVQTKVLILPKNKIQYTWRIPTLHSHISLAEQVSDSQVQVSRSTSEILQGYPNQLCNSPQSRYHVWRYWCKQPGFFLPKFCNLDQLPSWGILEFLQNILEFFTQSGSSNHQPDLP